MSETVKHLTKGEILNVISKPGAKVYFVGVGGVSMISLFCLSRHFGISVLGSDRKCSPLTAALIDAGADIVIGEREAVDKDTALLVYSHAVPEGQRERRFAREREIPEVTRAEYMGAIMQCYERRIGVSGSHGKSTVTAMISKIFSDAGLRPTTLSGASLFGSELPFSIGSLDYLIYEGCEYKDSFLSFSPTLSVFLNMELDHTDYFPTEEALETSFLSAMRHAEKIIVNADDEKLLALAKRSGRQAVTFGKNKNADYRYEIFAEKSRNMQFKVYKNGEELGEIRLSMLGLFNVSNATAAIAAALESSIDFSSLSASLSSFSGIGRRLEKIGDYKGRALYYDYAHHPTEISASVSAVRDAEGDKVTVIFRPHTYSRTKGLWQDFSASLRRADYAIILDIDAVRESEIEGVSAEALAKSFGGIYCPGTDALLEIIDKTEGAVILMGAADVEAVKKCLTMDIA